MIARKLKSFLVLAAGLAALAPAAAQQPQQAGRDPSEIVVLSPNQPGVRKATALVNGAVVTDTDVEQRLNLVVAANGGRVTADERERLRVQILRNLIDEKLQVQEATSKEITVSDEEVETTFRRVARNFKMEPAQFEAYLAERGTSSTSLRQQIRAELAWGRLLRRRVEPFVNVSDDEVNQVLTRLEEAKGKDEYRVGEIFLAAPAGAEDSQRQVADNIVRQVRQGASFIAYARQFSESASAAVGGDLGWVRAEQLTESLRPVVSAMQPGQVSDPVAVPGGITVLMLTEKRQSLVADPNNATLSLTQIGFDWAQGATEAQARRAAEQLQGATKAMGGCGRAAEVAKSIGAELSTRDSIRLGDLPGPLRNLIKDMRIGEVTPPFGSPTDGIRVLVLCGRDDAVEAKLPTFDELQAQMSEQKVSMMARRYLRDLRRDAIVDYR